MSIERRLYAVAAPGLEEITAGELRGMGARDIVVQAGGVAFGGSLERANRELRTASRVLKVLARGRAKSFAHLESVCQEVGWADYLCPGEPVRVLVTCRRSRLYHDKAVAERVSAILASGGFPAPTDDDEQAPAEVWIRLFGDRLSVSVDSSGERLHRRGYRLDPWKAPVRETLAAGILLASGWDPKTPLLDPMCGSGTFPIEAALMALGRPPGEHRHFAWERWPCKAKGLARRSVAPADSAKVEVPQIVGVDRDPGAIAAARANAERARAPIELACADIGDVGPTPGVPGLIVVNPPYGERHKRGRAAFRAVQSLVARFAGWSAVAMYAPPGSLPRGWEPLLQVRNGGINVRVIRYTAAP